MVDPIASSKPQNQANSEYLYNFLVDRLCAAFPNVSKHVTVEKVTNWFKTTEEKQFEAEIEDYLVLINRYSSEANQN